MPAILYASDESVYRRLLPDSMIWDEARDARRYIGPHPVVCHPPCRLWGQLRGLCTAPIKEMAMAVHAVEMCMRWGGVLEHPLRSRIWEWTSALPVHHVVVEQTWFGGKVKKPTIIMMAGFEGPINVPFRLAYPTHIIGSGRRRGALPELPGKHLGSRAETPIEMARWLCQIAVRCRQCGGSPKDYLAGGRSSFEP